MPLLIPGVGAQGGDLRLAVRYGCDRKGELAIINASRSILYASHGDDFAAAARAAALAMRDEINRYRKEFF
jgi:orotidine-5'-phosphate decarboxylase